MSERQRGISIIGSTGSIGMQALNVVRRLGLKVEALIAHSNLLKLKEQADEFNPKYIGVIDETSYVEAKELFKNYELICGKSALEFSCGLKKVETVLISITGINGIYPLVAAVKNKKRIALANKESIVAGGRIVRDLINKYNSIIPVDSEHSAILQCLSGYSKNRRKVKRLILTASGGAFYDKDIGYLKKISAKDIFHPTWNMGRKITIDSSTMMNKALEIIEARWLFDCKNIDYCIHSNSIIHGMVEFVDGSILAQMSQPSMELPIQYALTCDRLEGDIKSIDLAQDLQFRKKREDVFYAPRLALDIINGNEDLGVVMNAANEAAVNLFEQGRIGFLDIADMVKTLLEHHKDIKVNSIDDIISTHNDIIKKETKCKF